MEKTVFDTCINVYVYSVCIMEYKHIYVHLNETNQNCIHDVCSKMVYNKDKIYSM